MADIADIVLGPVGLDIVSRMTDQEVQYEYKSVRTVRGTEGLVRAKQEKDGWEFVDQTTATLQATLNFRRVKPPIPWRKIALGGVAAAVLATVIGVGALLESDNEKPAQDATPAPSASKPAPAPAAKIINITVDELLDKLNSANLGGIKNGDRFRVKGELFHSDLWMNGASGDYSVLLKAKGGDQDLSVFVDESKADNWKDGTKVEMVLKAVEVKIDGETTDGWLRVASAKTLSGGTSMEAKNAAADQKLFDAVAEYADALNSRAGRPVIDSIQPGPADRWIYVNLNSGLAAAQPLEVKTTIKTMNGQIMDIAEGLGASTPLLKYFLAGDAVAQNRYLLDPWDVKFEGMLDD